MKIKIGERDIIVRAVRGDFLRICGLTAEERQRLRKRLHKFIFKEAKLLVVQYGTNGRLEVEDVGTRKFPYEKRLLCTRELQLKMIELMKTFFGATAVTTEDKTLTS